MAITKSNRFWRIALECTASIAGAFAGSYVSFVLLCYILAPFGLSVGVDIAAYGGMFLGIPASSVLAMFLVDRAIFGLRDRTTMKIIFAFIACDLVTMLGRLLGDIAGTVFDGYIDLILVAALFAFLGYSAGRWVNRSRAEGNRFSP